jgi:hypothetical protein
VCILRKHLSHRLSLRSSKLRCAVADNTLHCVHVCRTLHCPPFLVVLQLVIGDSPLNLNLQFMNVSGTFQMGTPACPIQSLMNVFIPGGNSALGITVTAAAKYDVHAAFTVSGFTLAGLLLVSTGCLCVWEAAPAPAVVAACLCTHKTPPVCALLGRASVHLCQDSTHSLFELCDLILVCCRAASRGRASRLLCWRVPGASP